jgi:redox-sensitive bicupin YhaK (pirin superfamily)
MDFDSGDFLRGAGLAVVGAATAGAAAPTLAAPGSAVAPLGRAGPPPTRAAAPAAHARDVRRVATVLVGMPTSDGAGVRLTRVIGQPGLRNLDPFLLLDRFASDDPDAYVRGFPDHPHRGFETVTIMLEGRMRHRDTRGGHGLVTGGGVQWMTAGRGIIHSEMPEQDRGLMSGFQLWVNLPAAEKMCPAHYQDLPPSAIAGATHGAGGLLRVISGDYDGLRGPIRPRPTEPLLLTAVLADETPLEVALPREHTAFVFVHEGVAHVGPDDDARRVGAGHLAVLGPGERLRVRARTQRAGVLVAAARPLREPIVQRGPFVMNTEAEIRQAWADYRAGVLDRG